MFQSIGDRVVTRCGALLTALLLAACAQPPHALAAQPPAAARGSLSPSAPVELSYRLPERAPAGAPLTIDLSITTPLTGGELGVEVVKHAGVELQSAPLQRFDLAAAARPLQTPLELLPGADAERYVVLLISVDSPLGRLSRSFRISLPDNAAPAAEQGGGNTEDGMTILPSN
jgi:hypothetical protein